MRHGVIYEYISEFVIFAYFGIRRFFVATMTVSLPDPMKDWIEAQIRLGSYASVSDYVRDLVRRDRNRREQDLTLDELRRKLVSSERSGISTRTVEDVFADAMALAQSRGLAAD